MHKKCLRHTHTNYTVGTKYKSTSYTLHAIYVGILPTRCARRRQPHNAGQEYAKAAAAMEKHGNIAAALVGDYSLVIGGSSFSMNLDLMKCTTSILSMCSKAAIRASADHLGCSPHFFSRYRTGWRLSSKICMYWLKPRRTAKSLHSCMCACVWAQGCA